MRSESEAQQATLTADAHVSTARPTVNSGSLSNLNVGGGYTALLQFDLSTLPAGLTATQLSRATVRLFCNRADTPGAFTAQLLTSAWTESAVTYATIPGTGTTVASATCSAPNQFVTLDITSAVQGWLTAPSTNFGLALTAPTAVLQFDSKENDLTGHAPELDLMTATGTGSGVAGATGATGVAGPSGATGATGAQGLIGLQGIAGATGLAGMTGATGLLGPTGAQGATGAGLPGTTGATGSQGLQGVQGLVGPTGPGGTGSLGATGATGIPGVTGATGSAGLNYQGAYSSITNYAQGDVVLFAGSSYASLQPGNHGNTPGVSPAYWGALTSQGATGITGSAGPIGPTGAQGLLGPVGPAGEKGDQGIQGVAGQAGAQGIPGVTGPTGLQGPMGMTGNAGPTGLSFQGAYNSQTNYALADGVLWQGAGYVSLIANNHGNTPDQSPTAWALFAAAGLTGATGGLGPQGAIGATGATGIGIAGPTGAIGATGAQGSAGLTFQGTYASTANYAAGDAVSYLGASYVSLHAANHGNNPSSSPNDWSTLAAQGTVGATGSIGPQGNTGLVGSTGSIGVTGPTGAQGAPIAFTGAWQAAQPYATGDTVSYNGSSYIAIAANTAHQPDTSPAYWSVLAAIGATGAIGVTGSQGNTGSQGIAGPQGIAGQAGAQGIPGVTGPTGGQGIVGPTGAIGPTGLNFQGTYNSQTNYALGDGVLWGGAGYVSQVANNHGNTPDQSPTAWSLFAASGLVGATGSTGSQGPTGLTGNTGIGLVGPTGSVGPTGAQGAAGLAFQGAYSAANSYNLGDAVSYLGSSYVSLVASNHGNPPDSSPAAWSVLAAQGLVGPTGGFGATGSTGLAGPTGSIGATGAQGAPIAFAGSWSTTNTYAVGAAVSYGGSSYIAIASNTSRQPDVSPAYWSLLAAAGSIGATGAAGSTGQQGATGFAGANGATGAAGATGFTGLVGATGSTGSIGATGTTGLAGATGSNGLAGFTGATGMTGAPIAFAGAWSTSTSYAIGAAVSYNGSSYIAVAANSARQPDVSPAYWSLLAAQGSIGATGAVGSTGQQGPSGLGGAAGSTGATGQQGIAGLTGSTGAAGSTGAIGLTGATGPTGAAGYTGAAGLAGSTGATGTAGTPGLNFRGAWAANLAYSTNDAVTYGGSTYIALAFNTNASPDTTPQSWSLLAQAGSAGATGPTGALGNPGSAATIAVGTVTSLPAGSTPTVTNTGTSSAAIFAFGIPSGGTGSGTSTTASSEVTAMYHPVSYNTVYYATNTPNAAATETAAVLAWVPRGCTATRLDVYSQQTNQIKITLRSGTPGSMSDTALVCNFSGTTSSSCTATGSVAITAGSFLDFRIDNANSTTAGVWTSLECDASQ